MKGLATARMPSPPATCRWSTGFSSILWNILPASMKGANAEVEIYPDTHHGFAFPKRPVYHRDAAERHWERLLALYHRNLAS